MRSEPGYHVGIIASLWDDYKQGVVPADASAIQVQECRRAFYAGVHSILKTMAENRSRKGRLRGDPDADFASSVDAELQTFLNDVISGRA